MRYSCLEMKIAEKGIKKKAIAVLIGIAPRTLSEKLSGRSSFTWDEVLKIRNEYFPEMSLESLFAETA